MLHGDPAALPRLRLPRVLAQLEEGAGAGGLVVGAVGGPPAGHLGQGVLLQPLLVRRLARPGYTSSTFGDIKLTMNSWDIESNLREEHLEELPHQPVAEEGGLVGLADGPQQAGLPLQAKGERVVLHVLEYPLGLYRL